ncbi:hypothetical protein GIB67_022906, partial [Kingdonia uniflora]
KEEASLVSQFLTKPSFPFFWSKKTLYQSRDHLVSKLFFTPESSSPLQISKFHSPTPRKMGFMSRRVVPVCGHMCMCCPALRSRSRHPVKRYKKLLADIFPKSADAPSNERKIVKLCEYAAKNPLRIPKIAKYLEERILKELRNEHINVINIVMEAYNKFLCMCKDQMAFFSASLLTVIVELLDHAKQDSLRIIGCQTLTRFVYSQGSNVPQGLIGGIVADGIYVHNIESLVHKVTKMAHETGEEHSKCCLRASSLQCISAMVWFMGVHSHIFADFDEIVHVILDNFKDVERGEPRHNWVNEVVRSEARSGAVDVSPSYMKIMPRPEKKDPSLLTREEIETPKVWAQICIQKMGELAKESATMRRVMDPMFNYFDVGNHWVSRQGLAMVVLSEMSYLVECSGNEQVILAAIIRHLDHKNVADDPQVKSNIIQIATALTRQIRSRAPAADIRIISDLCRHLRKSLQATVELPGQQESNLNISIQNSTEDCLLETVKGIGEVHPIFDMMSTILENLPSLEVVARATVESMLILAHIVSLASLISHFEQVFPEALLAQLLKIMLHADIELRIGAHQIFAVLLAPTSIYSQHEFKLLRSGYLYERKLLQSKTASPFASATALFEKLRKEKESENLGNLGNAVRDCKGKELEEEFKHGMLRSTSPNFYKIGSIIDNRAGSTISADIDSTIIKLNEDQIVQLLSAFWIQANFADNTPSNFEALAHSFSLTLISSQLKTSNQKDVRFFQLPLSLRNIALNLSIEKLHPSCHRSLFILATAMLMFTARIYQLPALYDFLKSLDSYHVDPYLSISRDMQVYVNPQAALKDYGSFTDNQSALYSLSELSESMQNSNKVIIDIIARSLSDITELDTEDVAQKLSEMFSPDDTCLFGPKSIYCLDHHHKASLSEESLFSDEDLQTISNIEDDAVSEASVADLSRSILKVPASPSLSHIISVGQLLESALEVAGKIAGTSVLTSPLTYITMASQCEALNTGMRKKLSSWLAHEACDSKTADNAALADVQLFSNKITSDVASRQGGGMVTEQKSGLRLPPASPFDNFLKAAGC